MSAAPVLYSPASVHAGVLAGTLVASRWAHLVGFIGPPILTYESTGSLFGVATIQLALYFPRLRHDTRIVKFLVSILEPRPSR